MTVATSQWGKGTEFHFIFSADECAAMVADDGAALTNARAVVARVSEGWAASLGGILVAEGVAVLKVASDLRRAAKDYTQEYGKPTSFTYSLRRRDSWRGTLRFLDGIAGFWRKLSVGY
jgi:hypothetical protein